MQDGSKHSEELEQKIARLERKVSMLDSAINKELNLFRKGQEEIRHLIDINSMADAQANQRFQNAIVAIRAAIIKLGQSESQKLDFIKLAWDQQDKANKINHQSQHQQVKKLGRNNASVILIAIILYVVVVKNEVLSGELIDAIVTLVLGGGIAGVSIYENSKDN